MHAAQRTETLLPDEPSARRSLSLLYPPDTAQSIPVVLFRRHTGPAVVPAFLVAI
jgi:hypothetical protein